MNEKKINIHLDVALSKAFNMVASEMGFPKSKLLRSWMKEASSLQKIEIKAAESDSKQTSYSFLLTAEEDASLQAQAHKFDLSVSQLLRILIRINVADRESLDLVTQQDSVKTLLIEGKIDELLKILGDDLTKLTKKQLGILIEAYFNLGDRENINNVMNELTKRDFVGGKDELLQAQISYYQAHLELHYRKDIVSALDHLEKAEAVAVKLKNRRLLGNITALKARRAFLKGQARSIMKHYEKALDYLDPVEYPTDFLNMANMASLICMLLERWQKAKWYLKKAEEILETVDNSYYKMWFISAKVRFYRLNGDLDEAETWLEAFDSVDETIKTSYWFQLRSVVDRGLWLFENEKYKEAVPFLKEAVEIEQKMRPENTYCRTQLYLWYAEAQYDPESLANLQKYSRVSERSVEVELVQYYFASASFLYGKGVNRSMSAGKLKEMATSARFPLIQTMAQYVLDNKSPKMIV